MNEIEVIDGVYITNNYCIYLENGTIIIADLHLGYEGVLQMEGVAIPKYQKEVMLSRLKKIIEKYKPEKIIVNGDFKHNFSKNLKQEWREVKEFLFFISSKTKVLLIKGNHDNFLKTIANYCNVPIKLEENEMGITITHGHLDKKNSNFLIIAHEHPSIHLRDEVGAVIKLPCFLTSQDIIVLPAFSPLATGTDIMIERDDYLSPILQKANLKNFKVYGISELGLLDFSTLGKLRNL